MPDTPREFVLSRDTPEEDIIYYPASNRPHVTREDRDIDHQLSSERVHHTTTSKRTNEEIPEYLTKAFYDPKNMGGFGIPYVAREKATRTSTRDYSKNVCRDIVKIYDKAEHAFNSWWSHLEDDAYQDVDENAVKQEYLKEFAEAYVGQLYRLDRDHPENYEAYRQEQDGYIAHVKKFGRTGDPYVHYDYLEYFVTAPRWKQNIAADGRKGGLQAAEDDAEIGMGFREEDELVKLARKQFNALWNNLTLEKYYDDCYMFDFLGLRTIYVHNFMRAYAERAAGGQISAEADEISARVVSTHLDDGGRVYLIEISDPEHLDEPAQVEVSIRPTGDPE